MVLILKCWNFLFGYYLVLRWIEHDQGCECVFFPGIFPSSYYCSSINAKYTMCLSKNHKNCPVVMKCQPHIPHFFQTMIIILIRGSSHRLHRNWEIFFFEDQINAKCYPFKISYSDIHLGRLNLVFNEREAQGIITRF